MAALLAASMTEPSGPATIIVDCASVLGSWKGGPAWAGSAKRSFGGLWRRFAWSHVERFLKTKAHRSKELARAENSLDEWYGNDAADGLARRAAEENSPGKQALAEAAAEWTARKALLRGMATLLASWPSMEELVPEADFTEVPRPEARAAAGALVCPADAHEHCWVGAHRGLVCLRCHAFVASLSAGGTAGPCMQWACLEGMGPKIKAALRLGHDIFRASSWQHPNFVCCVRCGCYTETKFIGLARRCPGLVPGKRGVVRRMVQGRHPQGPGAIGPLYRCRLPTDVAAEAAEVEATGSAAVDVSTPAGGAGSPG